MSWSLAIRRQGAASLLIQYQTATTAMTTTTTATTTTTTTTARRMMMMMMMIMMIMMMTMMAGVWLSGTSRRGQWLIRDGVRPIELFVAKCLARRPSSVTARS